MDAGRDSGWAEKLAPSAHARVNKVELQVCAGQGEDAVRSAPGGDDREMHAAVCALLVDPENCVEAREVQKAHPVEVEDEERDAITVLALVGPRPVLRRRRRTTASLMAAELLSRCSWGGLTVGVVGLSTLCFSGRRMIVRSRSQ